MGRAVRIVKVVVINGVVLFILLLIAEYSFQYFNLFPQAGLQTYSYERYIELIEFVPQAEVNEYAAQIKCLELVNFNALENYKADSNGLFASGPKNQKNKTRIVILGDAQSCDLSLPSAYQLQNQLALKLDSNYEILNAAFPGSDLIHATNKMINTIMPLRPQKAIINYNLSDLLRLKKDGNYWGKIIGDKKKLRAWTTNHKNQKQVKPIADTLIINHFSKAYTNLIQLLKAWKVEPILMTQALNYDDTLALDVLLKHHDIAIGSEELIQLHEEINQHIRELSRQNKVGLIDSDASFSRQLSSFKNHLLFNERGMEAYSQLIADSINGWKLEKVEDE